MSKTSTDLLRHALNGPTMGTRWTALFFADASVDAAPIHRALQSAVDEIDAQMSTWKPDSDLMRINAAAVGKWVEVPAHLEAVVRLGLDVGRASGGAFDIGVGDAVTAWGFGPREADAARIRAANGTRRHPAHEVIELRDRHLLKRAEIALDLNGVAKGYAVDRLAATLQEFGLTNALVGIDGEMRAMGNRPDGKSWAIAIEDPDPERRTVHSVVTLENASVATSGDYRHWVEVQGKRLSHTMDPASGAPLLRSPASVTVVAGSCAVADAWATALMVLGVDTDAALVNSSGISALLLSRAASDGLTARRIGDWCPDK